ncbi:hypothetical protein OEZ85_010810 [Tetradesmus obliquus]|uniref:Uncharacterized protein n=2 Tax=Tetradesmus obliquus TaxID=3088 RepID=A0A383VZR0_TETOB|nr:hypothetical protein OEZ85_010810 [Tetradesmus obliquus]|eukprot:jgi/Sobl393_1/2181/SZX70410.1
MTGQDEGLHYRTATIDDLEEVVAANIAMAKETEDIDLPHDTVVKGVKAVLSGETHATYFLLEQGGSIKAQLMITYEWSDWRAAVVWWIQSVYVKPQHRKQGHFKALYNHVRDEAHKAGAAGLRLYADAANTRAHATYEKLGMSSHYKCYEDMFTDY